MGGERDLAALLEGLRPELHPDTFVFCSLQLSQAPPSALQPFATIREREGLTLVLTQGEAEAHTLSYEGRFRRITLRVHSSLEAVGLTAAVSTALASCGISANMLAGAFHDHILVPLEDAERAMACLRALSADGPKKPAPTLRIARPTDSLESTALLYARGLGLARLGGFSDHEGFSGVMLGSPGVPYHLELTQKAGHPAGCSPTTDDLLVFYEPDEATWHARCDAMVAAGFERVEAFNPYWDVAGRTFQDPEGYRVVIQRGTWPPRPG